MDETKLSLHPPLRACWMKRGQQLKIPAAGIQAHHHFLAAYSWRDDTVSWTSSNTLNSNVFIEFIEYLMTEVFPTGRIVLVMDNAPWHTSRQSRAALALFEHRLLIFWLPRYCSTLNPIERFWRYVKDKICVNKLFPSMKDVVDAFDAELAFQNNFNLEPRFSFLKKEV